MPRLDPSFKRTVFFLYERGMDDKVHGPKGTGVIVGMSERGWPAWRPVHLYAVTCAHVAPQGSSIVRINTLDGKSRLIEFEPHEWEFLSGRDDLAAIDISERVGPSDDIRSIMLDTIVSPEFIANVDLEIGEDGFMLGLFADLPGEDQNIIAARFGNVALLASEAVPIRQPNGAYRPSHVFDMRSRPGFSGSPVFVYRTPSGDLRNMEQQLQKKFPVNRPQFFQDYNSTLAAQRIYQMESHSEEFETRNNMFLRLLGIHAGQYPEDIIAKKKRRESGEADEVIRDRDRLQVPSSMTIVVPAWSIREVLSIPKLKAQREERVMKLKAKIAAKNVPIGEALPKEARAEPAADNPSHKEDFTSLLGRAARAKTKSRSNIAECECRMLRR